jgi:hypothetical protein
MLIIKIQRNKRMQMTASRPAPEMAQWEDLDVTHILIISSSANSTNTTTTTTNNNNNNNNNVTEFEQPVAIQNAVL